MHYAAGNGHSSVVEILIRLHANVNAVDKVSQCVFVIIDNEYVIATYGTNQPKGKRTRECTRKRTRVTHAGFSCFTRKRLFSRVRYPADWPRVYS